MKSRLIRKVDMFKHISVTGCFKKVLLGLAVAFILSVLLVSASGYNVYASSNENAGKYVTIEDIGSSNVIITDSFSEFKNMMESNAEEVGFDSFWHSDLYDITFKEDGMFIISQFKSFTHFYTSNSMSSPELHTVAEKDSFGFYPVTANTYYGSVYDNRYMGFIPASKIFKPAYYEQNDNGKIDFYFEIANDEVESIDVAAAKGVSSTIACCSEWFAADYYSEKTKKGAKISLPKHGTYTFMIEVQMESGDKNYFVKIFDTKDYTVKKIAKVDDPYSALAGTNVVVGKAESKAKVYISYQGKKYTAKADKNGIYRVKLASLKKGASLKIWQKSEGLTSDKKTIKIKTSY